MSRFRLFAPALSRRTLAAAGAAGAAGLALAGWGLWRRLSEPAAFDVVVIGSGAAGLSAAVAAAETGASVLVIEKQSEIGGNTLISGGYFAAVDPKRQKAQQIDDSEALFLKQMLESGGALAEPRLARTLVDGAGAALRWLESLGMRFQPGVIEIYGAHWPRCHKPMMPGGQGYIYALSAAAAKLGVTIAAHLRAERLEPLGSRSAPRGSGGWRIRCAGPDGEAAVFEARRGLVLASGGFGASRSMIEAFSPKLAGLTTDNTPGSTGEMLLEAARCGAALVGMEAVQCLPGCPPGRTHRVRLHNDVSRFIFVNGRGRRFIREDERRDVLRDAVLALPEGFAYTIVDDAGMRSYNILVQKEAVIGIETGDAWRGATVEKLAEAMGLPGAALRASVECYNLGVRLKRDEFGKAPAELIHEIITPPFWGCYAGMTIHYTMGGIRIDERARALDAAGRPIPKLFAAGEAAGGVHGANRMGANGINDAVVFGRLAGRGAAAGALAS